MVSHRVLYEQEAIHADPNHEEDGGVKVDVQDVAVYDANKGVVDGLLVCVQVGEVWQSAEENKVGDGQAEDVNVAALPLLQAKYVAKHDDEVAGEADAELERVERRQVVSLQHFVCVCGVDHLPKRKGEETLMRRKELSNRREEAKRVSDD